MRATGCPVVAAPSAKPAPAATTTAAMVLYISPAYSPAHDFDRCCGSGARCLAGVALCATRFEVCAAGVSEQARPHHERAPGSSRTARPASRLLWLLRLAFVGSRALDAGAIAARLSADSRGRANSRALRRALFDRSDCAGGDVLRSAEPAQLRANLRLGMALETVGRAARLGQPGRAPLGAGAAAAGRGRRPAVPGVSAQADVPDPDRCPSQHGLLAVAGARLSGREAAGARARAGANLFLRRPRCANLVGAGWRGLSLAAARGSGAHVARAPSSGVPRLVREVSASSVAGSGHRRRSHRSKDRTPRWAESFPRQVLVRFIEGPEAAGACRPGGTACAGFVAAHRERKLRRRALACHFCGADARLPLALYLNRSGRSQARADTPINSVQTSAISGPWAVSSMFCIGCCSLLGLAQKRNVLTITLNTRTSTDETFLFRPVAHRASSVAPRAQLDFGQIHGFF